MTEFQKKSEHMLAHWSKQEEINRLVYNQGKCATTMPNYFRPRARFCGKNRNWKTFFLSSLIWRVFSISLFNQLTQIAEYKTKKRE